MRGKILLIVACLAIMLCELGYGAEYVVPLTTSTVDGQTFCNGMCLPSDTIIIKGGARGDLLFQNFDGKGGYITIANEDADPDNKVIITNEGTSGWGVLSFRNCKYIDVRGDNDPDVPYGIKVINDGVPDCSGTIWAYGDSDYIKLGHMEMAFDGNTDDSGIGIQVQDSTRTKADNFEGIEIHHNYIHHSRYSAMYLGHNDPYGEDEPYVNNFSIHDNLMEDLGTYGITFKGSNSGTTNIYRNIVRRTGLVQIYIADPRTGQGEYQQGIGTAYLYKAGTTVNIYDNWIEKTKGNGIKIANSGPKEPIINVFRNTIVGCGAGNDPGYGYGVGLSTYVLCTVNVNDNIIINPAQYGLYAGGMTKGYANRNLIGGGLGESKGTQGIGEAAGIWLEGNGTDANIYHSDVAEFGFARWSDDDDYSNDEFIISTSSCGDTTCGEGENCSSCEVDCGQCPIKIINCTIGETPPCDGCVTVTELGSYLLRWKNNEEGLTLPFVMEAIKEWKKGCQEAMP